MDSVDLTKELDADKYCRWCGKELTDNNRVEIGDEISHLGKIYLCDTCFATLISS